MSSYWKENEDYYRRYNVRSVPPVWDISAHKGKIRKYLEGCGAILKTIIRLKKGAFSYYQEADYILSAGGGYLYSSKHGALGIGYVNALFNMWVGVWLGKKVIAFPQSFGPINSKLDQLMARAILNRIHIYYSRENISDALLEEIGIKNVKKSIDVAFSLKKSKHPLIVEAQSSKRKIGITVMDWSFANSSVDKNDMGDYIDKIYKALEIVREFLPLHVYIYPQVTVGHGDSDLPISQELHARLGTSNSTIIDLSSKVSPDEIIAEYGRMDAFIASRMHSAIFSIVSGTPTIGLAYQPKTLGTFKRIESERYCLDIREFTAKELAELTIEALTDDRETISYLQQINDFKSDLKSIINTIKQ